MVSSPCWQYGHVGACVLLIWYKCLARGMCLFLICVMVPVAFFKSSVVSLMYELLGAVIGSVSSIFVLW